MKVLSSIGGAIDTSTGWQNSKNGAFIHQT